MIKIKIKGFLGKISKYLKKKFKKKYKNIVLSKNKKNDCKIIFSSIKKSIISCKKCYKKSIPIVLGTTGFNYREFKQIVLFSKKIPIFFSSNFNVEFIKFFSYTKNLINYFNKFKIKGCEIHSISKKDSPSGSSFLIKKIFEKNFYFDSIRYKNILGEHKIIFFNKKNLFKISHKILNKKCYIGGIVKAIKYIIKKKNGLYKFSDL
ncbi:hypothetical protein ONB79_00420 [Candidatus Vidania fulgoroideae]|nr:hypothetical protein ONB79_00420 [Candidatus Vidania fulgoroideae]WDR79221.1 hypothetical protein ONB65_00715 [Candidatus Vidania fulgoroideae]